MAGLEAHTHYDVIIIGSGAGGGTLLSRLAPSGLRVLMLERGSYLPREKQNWDSRSVFLEDRYKAHDAWLDKNGKAFHPGTHYCVGGNTKVYGAALFRLRERDFEEVRHFGGVSPAWPIRYSDLAPYYTQAEQLYEVHGRRGDDPTEPAESEPYPLPHVPHEPRIQQLHDDFTRLGLRPFYVPLGIRLTRGPHSLCIRCATCDGYPCLVNAKSDAQTLCVDPSLAFPNVTLVTEAKVTRLLTDASGSSVRAVEVEREGETVRFEGEVVVLAAGAVNSAALLLRSRSDAHPRGLANGSGMVGRHYMCHNNSAMLAISRTPNPTIFQKTIAVNDFYFGADDSPFPLGHISMIGKSDELVLRAGAPPLAPGWVLERMAAHALDFWLTSEDLPHPDNRVEVTPEGQIKLSYTPNNEEAHSRLLRKLKSMLNQIGCEEHTWFAGNLYLGKKIPLAGVAHQCGTLRFGSDPRQSVLDTNCKAHELDNLYAADASFFVTSGAVNPALTIMANALRVGDHLLERFGKRVTSTKLRVLHHS